MSTIDDKARELMDAADLRRQLAAVEAAMMIRTDREAFIWEAPQPPRKSSLTNAIAWDDGDDDDDFGMDDGILTADYCTPSRHRSLTAQPQARPRAITYAQYDPAFDVDLHPELDVPVPPPAKPDRAPVPVPAEPGIPVDWPRRVVQPVPLSARR